MQDRKGAPVGHVHFWARIVLSAGYQVPSLNGTGGYAWTTFCGGVSTRLVRRNWDDHSDDEGLGCRPKDCGPAEGGDHANLSAGEVMRSD